MSIYDARDGAEMPEPTLAELHGMSDRETAIAKVQDARIEMNQFVAKALPSSIDFTTPMMTLFSLLTRAQAFHDGALDAVKSDNPFAAFTLIRSYAENAAVLVRLLDRPDDLRRLLPDADRQYKLTIGKITGSAPKRFGEFKRIYDQLSQFAHPDPRTALSGWRSVGEAEFIWSSAAFFKTDSDYFMACVWLVELAQANARLWSECWEMFFGDPKPNGPADEGLSSRTS